MEENGSNQIELKLQLSENVEQITDQINLQQFPCQCPH